MYLILNGGGEGKQVKSARERLNNVIDHNKKILYVPLAWDDKTFNGCLEFMTDELKDVNAQGIEMIRSGQELYDKNFQDYACIYIGGGNTFSLLKELKENKIIKKIQEYLKTDGIIYGGSAGAIIFGKSLESCKTDDENNVNLLDLEGFDLLNDYSLLCHYTNRDEKRTEESTNYLLELSKTKKICAIPEEDTLIVSDNNIEIIGERPFYLFENGCKTEVTPLNHSKNIKRKLGKFFEKEEKENLKYVKTIHTIKEYEDNRRFPINEVINADNEVNVYTTDKECMGGLNITTEEFVFRWLIRGDTLCEVTIPDSEKVYKTVSPNGVYRTNKIILSNPIKIDDDKAMELYLKSMLPENSYFKAMAGCAVMGYIKTAKKVFEDKVNNENIEFAISEFEDFCKPKNGLGKNASEIYQMLINFKNNLK